MLVYLAEGVISSPVPVYIYTIAPFHCSFSRYIKRAGRRTTLIELIIFLMSFSFTLINVQKWQKELASK